MTTRRPKVGGSAEDRFLAKLYPHITNHLAAPYAEDYDADAGRARFNAWLFAHTDPAEDDVRGWSKTWRERLQPFRSPSLRPVTRAGLALLALIPLAAIFSYVGYLLASLPAMIGLLLGLIIGVIFLVGIVFGALLIAVIGGSRGSGRPRRHI